jgi:hypothetical protein
MNIHKATGLILLIGLVGLASGACNSTAPTPTKAPVTFIAASTAPTPTKAPVTFIAASAAPMSAWGDLFYFEEGTSPAACSALVSDAKAARAYLPSLRTVIFSGSDADWGPRTSWEIDRLRANWSDLDALYAGMIVAGTACPSESLDARQQESAVALRTSGANLLFESDTYAAVALGSGYYTNSTTNATVSTRDFAAVAALTTALDDRSSSAWGTIRAAGFAADASWGLHFGAIWLASPCAFEAGTAPAENTVAYNRAYLAMDAAWIEHTMGVMGSSGIPYPQMMTLCTTSQDLSTPGTSPDTGGVIAP